MSRINDLRLSFINLINKVSDYEQLFSLYLGVKREVEESVENTTVDDVDKFEQGRVQIRKGVTKDMIFEEQGNKSITFDEVQEIVGDIEWELSLDELLATLD